MTVQSMPSLFYAIAGRRKQGEGVFPNAVCLGLASPVDMQLERWTLNAEDSESLAPADLIDSLR